MGILLDGKQGDIIEIFCAEYTADLTRDRISSIVKGLRHTAGILRGHQVLHHVADGGAYCKFVFRDGKPLRDLVFHTTLSQSKALLGNVHPREDAVILEILIGVHDGGGAAQTNQQGGYIRRVVPAEELLAGFRFLAVSAARYAKSSASLTLST